MKAPGCSSACLCREAAKSPGDSEGARQENWRGTARLLLLHRIYCQSRLQKIVWQNPEVIPSSVHSGKEDTAQLRTRAANPHPPTERKEARKVSEGAWGFLKEKVPSGSSGRGLKRGGVGGPLTLAGLRTGEFQASWFTNGWRGSRSAPEGGEHRAVPARWAGASRSRSCLSELRDLVRRRRAGAPGPECPQAKVRLRWVDATVRAQTGDRDELRGSREIPNRFTNSGLTAPACEPACLPNVTVK